VSGKYYSYLYRTYTVLST